MRTRSITAAPADSRLRFSRRGGGSWKEWDRFLELDGKPAFHIGNICNTCSFFFVREEGANESVPVEEIAEQLEAGISSLDAPAVDAFAQALPEGDYRAMLFDTNVTLVSPGGKGDYFHEEQIHLWGVDGFWDLPHHPRSFYYRAPDRSVSRRATLFQFVIPMFPPSWLDPEVVSAYENAQHSPTAVAISVLDVKAPATHPKPAPKVVEHYILAHYFLDGHHKTYAASRAGRPLRILSFLATEQGVSSLEEISIALKGGKDVAG